MKRNRIYQLIGAVAIATLLAGCDVKDPIYNTPHPDHGTVTLTTDWSGIGRGADRSRELHGKSSRLYGNRQWRNQPARPPLRSGQVQYLRLQHGRAYHRHGNDGKRRGGFGSCRTDGHIRPQRSGLAVRYDYGCRDRGRRGARLYRRDAAAGAAAHVHHRAYGRHGG